jgi:hypothetical protein
MRASLRFLVLVLVPALAFAQAPPRQELEAFGSALANAVGRVSRPGTLLAGSSTPRAFALPGYGVVFVLPPRALPVPRVVHRREDSEAARAFDPAIRGLEEKLKAARSAEERRRLERTLSELRANQAFLRAPHVQVHPFTLPVMIDSDRILSTDVDQQFEAIQQTERELQQRVAEQLREVQAALQAEGPMARTRQRQLQTQIRDFQQWVEAFRQQTEQARVTAEHQIRIQVGLPVEVEAPTPHPAPTVVAVPDAAAPAPPAAPPRARSATATASSTSPPQPVAPAPEAARPWFFWVGRAEEPEEGQPEDTISAVRTAVMGLLETRTPPRLARPEESLAVVVDFVPKGPVISTTRVRKTLVLRVRDRDLQDRRAGRISPDEFRRRVEATLD